MTVNQRVDGGQGGRVDHILVSPWLASTVVPGSYRVWADPLGERAQ